MSLGHEKEIFTTHVVSLIQTAWSLGYQVRIGEVFRTPEQQALYVTTRRSETMNSMHLKKCAIDLVLLRNNKICGYEEIKPLGDFWESLDPKNRWGGNWKKLVDTPHFERRV